MNESIEAIVRASMRFGPWSTLRQRAGNIVKVDRVLIASRCSGEIAEAKDKHGEDSPQAHRAEQSWRIVCIRSNRRVPTSTAISRLRID